MKKVLFMKNYRICALLAASVLCLSASAAGAVYEGSDFKQAVRLYKRTSLMNMITKYFS